MTTEIGLKTLFCGTEEEYIQEFCEIYKEEIHTPDGFIVFCKYLESTAKHVCRGGKKGPFQETRAMRIPWAKYILMNPDERIVLKDTSSDNILFFLTRKKMPHLVVCKKLDNKWNLISSLVVGGKRAEKYRKGKPPYEFLPKNL